MTRRLKEPQNQKDSQRSRICILFCFLNKLHFLEKFEVHSKVGKYSDVPQTPCPTHAQLTCDQHPPTPTHRVVHLLQQTSYTVIRLFHRYGKYKPVHQSPLPKVTWPGAVRARIKMPRSPSCILSR